MADSFSTKTIVLLIFITSGINEILSQQTAPRKHVLHCELYKREVYENVYSYSALVNGLPDFTTIIDNCNQPTPFIIGGSPAKPKEFPHMARLGFAGTGQQTEWFCGGTLLSKKYVLTAAHCFYSVQGVVNRVRLGELIFNSISDDARPEDFDVRRYIPHPLYRHDQDYNDIGLVELKLLATLSEYVAPACLPESDGDQQDKFYAVGWGATKFASADADQLSKVTLNRFDANRCRGFTDDAASIKMPHGLDSKSQICAGSTETKDTCHGDSGGPLLQFHGNFSCMFEVVGITSTGIGCGIAGIPAVYTRVFNYVNWIESIVW